MKLEITEEELFKELEKLYPDEVNSCPLNAKSFCDFIFNKYQPDSSKREDDHIATDGKKVDAVLGSSWRHEELG